MISGKIEALLQSVKQNMDEMAEGAEGKNGK